MSSKKDRTKKIDKLLRQFQAASAARKGPQKITLSRKRRGEGNEALVNADIKIRDYHPEDAEAVDSTALEAFQQFSTQYNEWEAFCKRIGSMSLLSGESEIVVAERKSTLCGAVAYYGPGKDQTRCFPEDWASMRLLVVSPEHRGQGVGRALMNDLIVRAKKDSSPVIGLRTSHIMEVALSMYLRMGFEKITDIAPIHGVPYATYKLDLNVES